MPERIPRVVIVGGGFGSLAAAEALRRTPAQIIQVDRANHHLFQPLLYQVATSLLSPAQIGSPIRGILREQGNVMVILGEVTGVEKEQKRILVGGRAPPASGAIEPSGEACSCNGFGPI